MSKAYGATEAHPSSRAEPSPVSVTAADGSDHFYLLMLVLRGPWKHLEPGPQKAAQAQDIREDTWVPQKARNHCLL